MKISLVIPAYNEGQYLGRCLASVMENRSSALHEIIVVDNASTDDTAAVAASFPGVRIFLEKQKGANHARNKGLSAASGDVIAFIDADTVIPSGWFEKIKNSFDGDDELACVSGSYRYYDGTKTNRFLLHALWWASAPLAYRFVGYMVLAGNFAARRSALQSAGGFDRNIAFYGDDTDIARRLSKHGTVRFRMDFFLYTSCRRFLEEGFIKTSWHYGINFVWPVLFRRPFTKKYKDVRLTPEAVYKNSSKHDYSPR